MNEILRELQNRGVVISDNNCYLPIYIPSIHYCLDIRYVSAIAGELLLMIVIVIMINNLIESEDKSRG